MLRARQARADTHSYTQQGVTIPLLELRQYRFVEGGRARVEACDHDAEQVEARVEAPTDQLRANFSLTYTKVNRPSDGSRVQLQMVPRARLEYQLTRALQLRLISQYALETRDSLRDDSRA